MADEQRTAGMLTREILDKFRVRRAALQSAKIDGEIDQRRARLCAARGFPELLQLLANRGDFDREAESGSIGCSRHGSDKWLHSTPRTPVAFEQVVRFLRTPGT